MIKRTRAIGAFWGLIAGMTAVGAISFAAPQVAFLWLNVVGAVVVVVVGVILSLGSAAPPRMRGLRRTRIPSRPDVLCRCLPSIPHFSVRFNRLAETADRRTPWETGAPASELIAYEREHLQRSVAYWTRQGQRAEGKGQR